MKSGIQMIEELYEKIELLSRRFSVIEQNSKEILNRMNEFSKPNKRPKIQESEKPNIQERPKIQESEKPNIQERSEIQESEKPKIISTQPKKEEKSKLTTRVFGKLKNTEGKMLNGITVIIYDSNNNKVKETRTNSAGEWLSFFSPGHYSAEYILQTGNIRVNINVTNDKKIIRVPLVEVQA